VVEVGLAQPPRAPGVAADGEEEAAEAFGGERVLGDLAAAVSGPERVVDPLVRRDRRGRAREAQGREGLAQCEALGPVEVEEGVVDVEENGAEAGQTAVTWRGR